MGFEIDQSGKVSVNHDNNNFGDTRIQSNPTDATTKCNSNPLTVHSLILRHKNHTTNKNRSIGDNCPLIYALKKKENLSITYNSFKPLVPNLKKIIEKFLQQQQSLGMIFQEVISMPSSHSISKILGNRMANSFSAYHQSSAFTKATALDVKQQVVNDFRRINHAARTNITNAANRALTEGREFSLSDVSTKHRKFVQHISLNPNYNINYDHKILLVDDLFATGKTLTTAKSLLIQKGVDPLMIVGLCLFSPLDGRIR